MRGICMYVYMCVRHPDCHHRRKTWNGRDEGGWGVHGCVRHPDCTTLAQKKRPPGRRYSLLYTRTCTYTYTIQTGELHARVAGSVVGSVSYCIRRIRTYVEDVRRRRPERGGDTYTRGCACECGCVVWCVWCVWGGGRRFDVPTGKGRRHEKPDKSRNKRLNLSRS